MWSPAGQIEYPARHLKLQTKADKLKSDPLKLATFVYMPANVRRYPNAKDMRSVLPQDKRLTT